MQKPDKYNDKFYTPKGESHESEDRRKAEIAEPIMNLYNGFFAAPKNHEILNCLYQEFLFKNRFFKEHRSLINLICDHCSTNIILSLMGQFAYNDLYRSLYDQDKDLFDKIVQLDLNKNMPYAGMTTWRNTNNDDCILLSAALYDNFRDKNLDLSHMIEDKNLIGPADNLRALDWFTTYKFTNHKGKHFPLSCSWSGLDNEWIHIYRIDIDQSEMAAKRMLGELLVYRKIIRSVFRRCSPQ